MHTYVSIKFPLYDAAGAAYAVCGISTDITDRKRAEEESRRRQEELAHVTRLSTMGEMATGLAHELNQPLAAIVNYTQGCMRRMRAGIGDPEELIGALEQATAQAGRASQIIRWLRDFTRKTVPRQNKADINEIIRDAEGFFQAEARQHQVSLRLELTDFLPPIRADVIQVEQVLLNLVRNGIEAMASVDTGKRILVIRTAMAGEALEIAVQDSGPGIFEKAADSIFNPFFTTKSQGMGMGLSISKSIIEAHGGRLWAESGPDGGAVFRFTLPVSSIVD
jgi:C4-dicarboxylate-specific signal transduction histidine kinase